jgi:hypothetical protein
MKCEASSPAALAEASGRWSVVKRCRGLKLLLTRARRLGLMRRLLMVLSAVSAQKPA